MNITFENAIQSIRDGNIPGAAAIAEKLLTREPKHVEALRLLGKIRLQDGGGEAAIGLLECALDAAPEHAELRYEIGVACLQTGKHAQAAELFRQQLDRSATHWECSFNLAWALVKLGRHHEALPYLEHCSRLVPSNRAVWLNLGNAYANLKRPIDAAEAYERSIAAGERQPSLLLNAINTYVQLNNRERANQLLALLLQAAPNSSEYTAALGIITFAQHGSGAATEHFKDAAQLGLDDAGYLDRMGWALRALGRSEEIVFIARAIIANTPDHVPAYELLGQELAKAAQGYPPEKLTTTGTLAHARIFERFGRWEGTVSGGLYANFLGVLTRRSFVGSAEPDAPAHVQADIPEVNEEFMEWLCLLHAAVDARGSFTMLELGAGYGRWLVNGYKAIQALAANDHAQAPLPCHLLGIEADTAHFQMMHEHFFNNGINPVDHRLIEAAVTAQHCEVMFAEGDPQAWWGQAIVADTWTQTHKVAKPGIPLETLLEPYDFVDFIDADVQNEELKVFVAARQALDKKVKRVHIGTHSRAVEYGLRELFHGLGWQPVWDYGCYTECATPFGRISFEDGVQVWLNPAL